MSTSTVRDTEMTETMSLTAQEATEVERTFLLLSQHLQVNCTPRPASINCSCGAKLPASDGNNDWPQAQRMALIRHHAEVLTAAKLALAETPDQVTFSTLLRTSTNRAPEGWSEEQWHRDATADSGTSHTLVGTTYVVQCQWCPATFIGERKADAMRLFRTHEEAIQTGQTSR